VRARGASTANRARNGTVRSSAHPPRALPEPLLRWGARVGDELAQLFAANLPSERRRACAPPPAPRRRRRARRQRRLLAQRVACRSREAQVCTELRGRVRDAGETPVGSAALGVQCEAAQ
jgi:hypothetical protein